MRSIMLFLIIPGILWGCLEELEPNSPSFEKIYGADLGSWATGMTLSEDGGFMVYGLVIQSIRNPDQVEKPMPYIISVDKFGNELWSRTYPMEQFQLYRNDFAGIHQTGPGGVAFRDLVELENGKHFALIVVDLPEVLELRWPGFLILDQQFNIDTLVMFNQEDMEIGVDNSMFRGWPTVHPSPSGDGLFLLMHTGQYLHTNLLGSFYSIYKISAQGTLLSIFDMKSDIFYYRAEPSKTMVFDEDGNAIVVGQRSSIGRHPCTHIFLHRIDLNTGVLLEESIILDENLNTRRPNSIVSTGDGYVIQENYALQCFGILDAPTVALDFVNSSLQLESQMVLSPRNLLCGSSHLFGTRDGGFAGILSTCDTRQRSAYKVDRNGVEIWRSAPMDLIAVGNFLETPDGGFAIAATKGFNLSGNKMTLIKLDRDGNLK